MKTGRKQLGCWLSAAGVAGLALAAFTRAIAGPNGVSYSYEWYACDACGAGKEVYDNGREQLRPPAPSASARDPAPPCPHAWRLAGSGGVAACGNPSPLAELWLLLVPAGVGLLMAGLAFVLITL